MVRIPAITTKYIAPIKIPMVKFLAIALVNKSKRQLFSNSFVHNRNNSRIAADENRDITSFAAKEGMAKTLCAIT